MSKKKNQTTPSPEDSPKCIFCGCTLEVGEQIFQCPECQTFYHAECWQSNGNQCPRLGCPGSGEPDYARKNDVLPSTAVHVDSEELQRWFDRISRGEESVFLLRNSDRTGTGFAITKEGYILTCNHVMDSETVEVISSTGKIWITQVMARDKIHDLAILKIDESNISCLTFADPVSIDVGQKVYALGHPIGFNFTVAEGYISEKSCMLHGVSFIESNVALSPGNSGGPLINDKGEVVGIVNGRIEAQGISFAMAVRHIFAFAAQLRIRLNRTDEFSIL